ncbi:two-component system, NtrC family, response regulator PilR/two-component system, NtrC family, response regulator HydG/two-component system, NtrC family, response regulator AtoC [Verrucomicrobium sp. GAS474]|uniref:sigma-54-dependent transcriptional regulator n=1 Tax=Verrucomicrobium sp. GAS474 TaxID=1882831 RepID=UPI00087D892B|nr:sigma-54 dependent transcriptional regulator [Verrucomicrobium sp. GAS474]SDT91248.1 two-component system, NtrC family, response regulator PilR/two-component system, NtrC family, response regulator HydG/two-component system, NtrC family, response regulator AtoC [Verrucomicrobium sp. GAS474]
MQFERVIVVDDDPLIRRLIVGHLQKQNLPVLGVVNCQQAIEAQQKEPADLMIIDLLLPDGNGLEVMQAVKKLGPVECIIVTSFGSIESAVDAMKMGAANYLLKPFTLAQFDMALSQLLEQRKLREENDYLKEQLAAETSTGELLYTSTEMAEVEKLIKRVGPTNATVLIEGESGTGKELVARAIHQHSQRANAPYIKVNCAAVPENLLESEFFGHEKGSFTGASSRREGRFELANGGTLLLDEVTEISLGLQAKLLRVLQEKEFERVGGNRTIRVDVRILATTNRDIERSIAAGDFRQDLYFRLNVVPVKLPALRERAGEVEYLLKSFLDRLAKKYNKPTPIVSEEALRQLSEYHWPGNVRELQNYAERAVILAEENRALEFHDFISSRPGGGAGIGAKAGAGAGGAVVGSVGAGVPAPNAVAPVMAEGEVLTVEEMEKRLIGNALKKTKGNRNEAARLLGINVRTLRNKLNQYQQELGLGAELTGEDAE